ncbi:MAG TPA: cupredoxin domain-containing protein [Patescibacteria group bacterium]|nr:cupredoxin domain-containing protein [Patescibacteria group bacterium]
MNKKNITRLIVAVVILVLGIMLIKNLTHKDPKPPVITPPRTASVNISEDGLFVPDTLKVKVGTVVIWTNVDSGNSHRVAADPYPSHSSLPSLDSKTNMAFNGTYRYAFNKAGTYHYHDELHPEAAGTIIVQ